MSQTVTKAAFEREFTNYYSKDGLFLHYQAKVISTLFNGNVNVMTDKDVLLYSDIEDSDITDSRLISVGAIRSIINRSVATGSQFTYAEAMFATVIDSKINVSKVLNSTVHSSELMNSTVENESVVTDSVLVNSTAKNKAVINEAVVEKSILDGCIVEQGVKLSGIVPHPGTYFKHGFWERNPVVVDIGKLRYLIVEDVNDRVLIGCQSRPALFWLSLLPQQAANLGEEFEKNFDLYREAVETIQRHKLKNPSPEVVDTKPNDVLYTF